MHPPCWGVSDILFPERTSRVSFLAPVLAALCDDSRLPTFTLPPSQPVVAAPGSRLSSLAAL